MERLISQILEMSRLQAGSGIAVNPVDTDVSRLIREIVQETNVAYPGFDIELDIDEDVQAVVDPDRYAQMAVNLLSNARHHKLHGSPVQVRLKQDGTHCHLHVLNQAAALSTEQLQSLFEPFKQVNHSGDRNRTGLGIGLYIAAAIAEAHAGSISVDQTDGLIAFRVILPRRLPLH